MMPTTSRQVLKQFADSVLTLLDEYEAKMKELKKLKESERTKIFHTQKMIRQWFIRNGGM